MNACRSRLRLVLFVSALATQAAAADGGSGVAPGRWELSPAPDSGSYLCLKRDLLESVLCESLTHELGGAADVRLNVGNDGGGHRMYPLPALLRGDDGDELGFSLELVGVAGRTDELSCGAWSWRLVREPQVGEDATPVTRGGGGFVATTLDLPAEIEFESAEGVRHRLPYRVSVAFNGLSALVPLWSAGPLLDEGYSNLLLMAAPGNGCYRAVPACWTSDTCGVLCLGASQHSLDLANTGAACGATGH